MKEIKYLIKEIKHFMKKIKYLIKEMKYLMKYLIKYLMKYLMKYLLKYLMKEFVVKVLSRDFSLLRFIIFKENYLFRKHNFHHDHIEEHLYFVFKT